MCYVLLRLAISPRNAREPADCETVAVSRSRSTASPVKVTRPSRQTPRGWRSCGPSTTAMGPSGSFPPPAARPGGLRATTSGPPIPAGRRTGSRSSWRVGGLPASKTAPCGWSRRPAASCAACSSTKPRPGSSRATGPRWIADRVHRLLARVGP